MLEDTVELQCIAEDHVPLRTKPGVVSMAELVRSTLRLRPDRIVVGEVRGGEALDLLKAWGTGHPGGIATIHAGSAHGALMRLEQLIQEAVVTVPRPLIAETIDVIVIFIAGRGRARRVEEHRSREGLNAEWLSTWSAFAATSRRSVNAPNPPFRTSAYRRLHEPCSWRLLTSHFARGSAIAAGSNMPWEAPLQSILESIQGPVARIIAVIIIIVTGLTLAFGDTSGGFRKLDPDRLRALDRLRRVVVLS